MMPDRFLIAGAFLVSMDPAISDGETDVLVEDGVITAVSPRIEARKDVPVVDGADSFLLPGFVDTHRHCWQGAVRLVGAGWDVDTYMANGHARIAPEVSPAEAYLGNLVSARACLDSGITTVCDESHVQHSWDHSVSLIKALRDSGIRGRFGFGWSAGTANLLVSSDPMPAHFERVRHEILSDDTALVTMYAMLRGPVITDTATCMQDIHRARDLGLRMSFHVGHRNKLNRRDYALLGDTGLLGPDMLFIHGGDASKEELSMMCDNEIALSISSTIESQMEGVGAPSPARVLAAGVRIALSSDTEIAIGGDFFALMRATMIADQLRRMHDSSYANSYDHLTPRDILRAATIDGARACGLGSTTGSVTPGKRADLIMIDRYSPNMIGAVDPTAVILHSAHPGNVHTVFVDGVARKKDGFLTDGLDPRLVHADQQRASSRLSHINT